MERKDVKEILAFLLSSFRARLAIQDVSEGCPFDYTAFLEAWRAIKSDEYYSTLLSVHLNYLVQQGLLDSLLPYLRSSFKIRASLPAIEDGIKSHRGGGSRENVLPYSVHATLLPQSSSRSSKSRQTPDRTEEDCDIVIHVCDEGKGIWKDFTCLQSILLKGMGYFSRVTVKGQRLQDMDISVHCDIGIFEWLLRWIHRNQGREANSCSENASIDLDAHTVIGLVVSADFLQMPALTTTCLEYLFANIEAVIMESPSLGCLSESLTRRLTLYFSVSDLETRVAEIDRTDRIASRLYIQFIMLQNCIEPKLAQGHLASTASLFKCKLCSQLLTNEVASMLPCNTVKFDCFGRQFSCHVKDGNWSLPNHIRELKRELKSWRKVYWRLWGTVNFFCCTICHFHYPARFSGTCKYHPEPLHGKSDNSSTSTFGEVKSQAFRKYFHRKNEGNPTPELPPHDEEPQTVRKYPCCKAPAYRFAPLPHAQGCQAREHVPTQNDPTSAERIDIFKRFHELIVEPEESPYWNSIMSSFKSEKSWSLLNGQEEPKQRQDFEAAESLDGYSGSEDGGVQTGSSRSGSYTTPRHGSLWSWNPDLTTRYNQDMQRELEEKYMINLCSLLAQRIPLDSHAALKF